jgi:photosystem II stability/assembly factor-like uncharacterized protein
LIPLKLSKINNLITALKLTLGNEFLKKFNSIMKKMLILCLFYSFIYAQWEDRSIGLPEYWSLGASLDAVDQNTAVVSLQNGIYLTTDAGVNWSLIANEQNIPNLEITDISMVLPDKIWFCTSGVFPKTARIFYSPDGGKTWRLQFEDPEQTTFFNYIEMFDSLSGIAMGDAPVNSNKPALFLKTTDGGNNWFSVNKDNLRGAVSGDLWRRLDFVNENVGYFFPSGILPQELYKTTDSGAEWEVTNFSGYAAVVKFVDEFNGIVVGKEGEIYITSDGGINWIFDQSSESGWPYDVEFVDGNYKMIWMALNKRILYTDDGGKNWYVQYLGENFTGIDLKFVDKYFGWLVATNQVLYTTVGGVDLSNADEASIIKNYFLYQNYPNPFNPVTNIRYMIPKAVDVTLSVYNILGEKIIDLVNKFHNPGDYQIQFSAKGIPSGVYFYRLTARNNEKDFIQTRKLIIMK